MGGFSNVPDAARSRDWYAARWAGSGVYPPGHVHKSPVPGRWIAVDLHGTLANHDATQVEGDPYHIGVPIPAMVSRVKAWIAAGHEVRIFTAKIFPLWKAEPTLDPGRLSLRWCEEYTSPYEDAAAFAHAIDRWVLEHVGTRLTLTCVKDRHCRELWDDKAVPVEKDTGRLLYDGEREFT